MICVYVAIMHDELPTRMRALCAHIGREHQPSEHVLLSRTTRARPAGALRRSRSLVQSGCVPNARRRER